MKYRAIFGLLVIAPVLWAELRSEGTVSEHAIDIEAEYAELRPLLISHCYDCHGGYHTEGGLDLVQYKTVTQIKADRETWARVKENIEFHIMPPVDGNPLAKEDIARISQWLDDTIYPVDWENPDPGFVVMRRLNRQEYNNTIRDLVGVDFKPAQDFPVDDTGHGFDTIGAVLTLSPMLLEKYMQAAESVLDAALFPGKVQSQRHIIYAEDLKGDNPVDGHGFCVVSGSGGRLEASAEHLFEHRGKYKVSVYAIGDQAGPEKVKLALSFNQRERQEFTIVADRNDPSEVCELDVHVDGAGKGNVLVTFLNDFYDANIADPKKRDRNLRIEKIEIEGPFYEPLPGLDNARKRLLGIQPIGMRDMEYARQVIGKFASRAFRRPVTQDEATRLLRLVSIAKKAGASLVEGIQLALKAVLVSPHFLYREEYQPSPDNEQAIHEIDEFALASRLSYFLWSSMPDDELFREAQSGTLRQNLDKQVHRMLRDRKAGTLAENFGGQWLELRNLKSVTPNPELFPTFDEALSEAMMRESELFFKHIHWQDLSVLTFLNADFTFVNERLARHYGIPDVTGAAFRKVSTANTPRGGILTQASFLTVAANPTRTSPVLRGKWVLENVLGKAPPPPPANAPDLSEAVHALELGSLRKRMELHSTRADCVSCHRIIDPIGFAFENFDALGRYREMDGEFPIETAGQLYTGEYIDDYVDLRELFTQGKKDVFIECLVHKMLTFALGRPVEYYDKPAVTHIIEELAANDYRFSSLILSVVKSTPFQKRRGTGYGADVAQHSMP